MNKNIFYINETDKEKNLNLNKLNIFDSKKIGLVLSANQHLLTKHWIKFQQEWVNNIYKNFRDHDKYIILIYLASKNLLDNTKLLKFNSIDEYYSQSMIYLPDISLAEISMNGTNAYNWIADNIFIATAGDYFGSLLFALWIMFTCWLIGYIMDKKGVYIKV